MVYRAAPNATVAPFYNRMPVVLAGERQWDICLDPEAAPAELIQLLAPADSELLEEVTVARGPLRIKEPGRDVLGPV
jgi:putative SOS response-associated peptidase YedK